ncbi:MAG TPA: hypothetical protein VLZ50_05645 [Terracidiphilus sp.]|nr:hypothetical protein [Terracidiphilus sp.]
MSETKRPDPQHADADDDRSRGPNLALIYSLIALAMLVAMGIALWIVMPFYTRR